MVCDKWKNSFEGFWADMQETWSPGMTIDRIDVDGNYEPSNCQWLTADENRKKRWADAHQKERDYEAEIAALRAEIAALKASKP